MCRSSSAYFTVIAKMLDGRKALDHHNISQTWISIVYNTYNQANPTRKSPNSPVDDPKNLHANTIPTPTPFLPYNPPPPPHRNTTSLYKQCPSCLRKYPHPPTHPLHPTHFINQTQHSTLPTTPIYTLPTLPCPHDSPTTPLPTPHPACLQM